MSVRGRRDGNDVVLRAGRQEMAYGSQRLVSVRESPTNRLAFDAVRVLTKFGEWRADAWVGQPVEIDTGVKESLPAQRNGNYVSAVAAFRF